MLAFMIGVTTWLSRHEPLSHVATEKHFHDLGEADARFRGVVDLWNLLTVSDHLVRQSGPKKSGGISIARLGPGRT